VEDSFATDVVLLGKSGGNEVCNTNNIADFAQKMFTTD
jgi:hypothetical protein